MNLGVTLVILPLISLIKDQINFLKQNDINVTTLSLSVK